MKKIILVFVCAALMTACKKNGSSPKTILLSKVLVDGHTEVEYIYNSAGQLITEKFYEEHSPFSYIYRNEYTYDASGKPKEFKGYNMPSNQLEEQNLFTLDGQGRIVRTAYYSINGNPPGTFSTYIDNEYNANGRVSKQTWKDEDEKVQTYRQVQYYPNGNMRTSETWHQWGGPVAEKAWGASYGPSDTSLPASFFNVKVFPVNFYYAYLACSYINHFNYEDGLVSGQYREEMSNRQFNARGLVTQETITTKSIKPAGPESVRLLQFEYIEQ
jgi:hypothetical protein